MSAPKVWLITGCGTGLGKAMAYEALKRGDRVIATARNLAQIEDLKQAGAKTLQLDVTSAPDVLKAKAAEAEGIWGQVDVLVNSAGYAALGTLEELGTEGLMAQFAVNVFGVAAVTNAFLPYFRARKAGTVVILGSRSGWRTLALCGAYASSKAAVNMLSECFARELEPLGIRVLTLVPGGFATDGQTANPKLNNPSTSHPTFSNIPDYEPMRAQMANYLETFGGSQLGDPQRFSEIVVDIVRGEGVMRAKDGGLREWPERLVMGSDSKYDIKLKTDSYLKSMTDWEDVLTSTDTRQFE